MDSLGFSDEENQNLHNIDGKKEQDVLPPGDGVVDAGKQEQ